MLTFVLGRASGGKSTEILSRIRACVQAGGRPILLVPEQYSFESEKAVLDLLGDAKAQAVSVVSFTRLCDTVEREIGGLCGRTLTEADRLIVLQRAVVRCAPQLQLWQRCCQTPGFLSMLSDTVSELKLHAVTADALRQAALAQGGGRLTAKLNDTALLLESYDALLTERFLDPDDRLNRLCDRLVHHSFFAGHEVFLDSFKGFTGQQYALLDRIFSQTDAVTVSLTEDVTDTNPIGLFSGIRKTRERITRMAASHGVKTAEPVVLDGRYGREPQMEAVERQMAGYPIEGATADCVTVCCAKTVFDEVEFAARTLRRIVRENPDIRYRDMVIIARDTAPYEEPLLAACRRYGIPCFLDRRQALSTFPPSAVLLSALEAMPSLACEAVFRFHKSGISLLSLTELSELENYVTCWQIASLEAPFTLNPFGLKQAEEKDREKTESKLAALNELRERAVRPLLRLRKNCRGTAEQMARAALTLFDDCQAKKAFTALSEKEIAQGNAPAAETLRAAWATLMQVLDSMVRCFGEVALRPTDFCEALRTAVGLTTVGLVPQMLDEVTFGAADRIRPSRPRVAVILGADQGVFPRLGAVGGLFAAPERETLINLGLDLPNRTEDLAVDEAFLVYTNVCCPTDLLTVCYHTSAPDGSRTQPSDFVKALQAMPGCRTAEEPSVLTKQSLPGTAEAAFSEYCRRLGNNDPDAAVLQKVLREDPRYAARLQAVWQGKERPHFSLSEETALRLFGRQLRLSPSKLDTLGRCPFSYFCRHGLKAESRQTASFDTRQRGTLAHAALQSLVESFGRNLATLTEERRDREVEAAVDAYLDAIPGYRRQETPRTRFLVSTEKRSLKDRAAYLAEEMEQSDFVPTHCEMKIGPDGVIAPLTVPIGPDRSLSVIGTVDRVDRWNGYVRVLDYKTGSRRFCLPDVLYGQNMQMLLYLYAVSGNASVGGEPAGIFYLPVGHKADGCMSGILLDDDAVVEAMEKDGTGRFLPKRGGNTKAAESYVKTEDFETIFSFLNQKMRQMGLSLQAGEIEPNPVDGLDSEACKYCEFGTVCRRKDEKHPKVEKKSYREVLETMKKGET